MEPMLSKRLSRLPILIGGLLGLVFVLMFWLVHQVDPLNAGEAVAQASQYVERTMPGIHLDSYHIAVAPRRPKEPWRVEFTPTRPQGRFVVLVREGGTCELIRPEEEGRSPSRPRSDQAKPGGQEQDGPAREQGRDDATEQGAGGGVR